MRGYYVGDVLNNSVYRFSSLRVILIISFLAGLTLTTSLLIMLVPGLLNMLLAISGFAGNAVALIAGLLPLWVLVALSSGCLAVVCSRSQSDKERKYVHWTLVIGIYDIAVSVLIIGAFVFLLFEVGLNVPV